MDVLCWPYMWRTIPLEAFQTLGQIIPLLVRNNGPCTGQGLDQPLQTVGCQQDSVKSTNMLYWTDKDSPSGTVQPWDFPTTCGEETYYNKCQQYYHCN